MRARAYDARHRRTERLLRPMVTEDDIREVLRTVVDPELGINVVDLGLVQAIDRDDSGVHIEMTMTSPACPLKEYLKQLIAEAIEPMLDAGQCVAVEIVDAPWSPDMMSEAARQQLGDRSR
jgi:metal-sulfur cluster biosynthetic enzyme